MTIETMRTPTTSLLDNAFRIARRADVHPRVVKGKLVTISLIFLVNVVIAAATVTVAGLPKTESAQLLASFVFFGSLAVMLASLGALFVVIWSAYVYQYVEATEAQSQTEEATIQTEDILQAFASIREDKQFPLEVIRVLNQTWNLGLSSVTETKMIQNQALSQHVYQILRDRIIRREDINILLKDIEEGKITLDRKPETLV